MKKQKQKHSYIQIDIDRLEYWLTVPREKFFALHGVTQKEGYQYLFKPAKEGERSDVLLVAHLDTVQNLSGIKAKSRDVIHAHGLDDRLGAYIAYDLLPSLGCNLDILLTDCEEIGKSTAEFFGDASAYNWIAEFDRAGGDVVNYGLDSPAWKSALKKGGFHIGRGSFSDIAFLPDAPCCVNIGTGVEKSHAVDSFFLIPTMRKMIHKFLLFHKAHHATRFEQSNPVEPENRESRDWWNDGLQGGEYGLGNKEPIQSGNGLWDNFLYAQPDGGEPVFCEDCGISPAYASHVFGGAYLCPSCESYYAESIIQQGGAG